MAAPTRTTKPPLEDPHNERELFANEVVAVGAMHGNITITLANARFDEPIGANPPTPHRIVVARIVLAVLLPAHSSKNSNNSPLKSRR
jgi:hypothetical protein